MNIEYLWLLPLALFLSTSLSRIISLFSFTDSLQSYEQVEKNLFSGGVGVQILTLVVVMPLMEEMIFRGLIYSRLKKYINNIFTAAITTSALFALYHFNLAQGIYTFILSIVLIYMYEKYNNILAPIIIHMFANLCSVLLTFTRLSQMISDNILVYIIVMMLEIIGAVGMILLISRRKI